MGGLRGGAIAACLVGGVAALAGCGNGAASRQTTTTNPGYYSNFTPQTPHPAGTDHSFTGANPYKDPCSLITAAEVGAIVGQAVVSAAGFTNSSCDYRTADKLKVYTVAVPPVGNPHTAYSVFKRNSQPVKGLGDEAYCSAPARVVTLYILKGQHLIEVTGTDCALNQKLAEKVLTRA